MAHPLRLSSVLSPPSSFPKTSMQLQVSRQSRTLANSYNRPTRPSHEPTGTKFSERRISRSVSGIRKDSPAISVANKNHARVSSGPSPSKSSVGSPAYQSPQTGLLSLLPPSWVPYAELIRLDKPTGTYYLFFPCLYSTLLAAPLTSPISPPLTVLSTSALFFAGALIMRGAGCTVNDLWDRDLDPHVARTRLRPIARGAITVRQAIPFLGAQLLAGLGVLVCFPAQCLYYGIPSLLLVGTYPLAKRVTNYPQFVLGLTFSWGAIMGFPALGIDLLSNTSAMASAGCLYASCVAWTIVYDMIYAYQDIRDDAAAGIKSIALAQARNAKTFLGAVAAVQISLLGAAGFAIGAGPVFYLGSCGSAAATIGYMIAKADLSNVDDCWRWFKKGAWLTGGTVSLGLVGEYFMQYFGLYETTDRDTRPADRLAGD